MRKNRLWRNPYFIFLLISSILLLSVLMINSLLKGASQHHQEIYNKLLSRQVDIIENKIKDFFRPTIGYLFFAQKWVSASKTLDLNEPQFLNRYFLPVIKTFPQINGMIIADSDGNEYMLTKRDNAWLSRSINSQASGDNANFSKLDANGELLEEWTEKLEYDPRLRPWFIGEEDRLDEIHWTKVYQFFTEEKLGITASIAGVIHDNTKRFVLASDMLLQDILDMSYDESESSNVELFFLSKNEEDHLSSLQLMLPINDNANTTDLNRKLLLNFLSEQWQLLPPAKHSDSFRCKYNEQLWWAKFIPVSIVNNTLWIAIAFPESEFLANELPDNKFLYLLTGGIVFISVTLIALLLTIFFRKEALLDPHKASPEIISSIIEKGETSITEFKSTIRWDIKAKQNAKWMELAWLKNIVAFLNTSGGLIFIGVDDDGNIVGLDNDEFQNDDKCLMHIKNLINEHIGIEFSKYINFAIREIRKNKILLIAVQASKDPAFLKAKNNEEFYVRVGTAAHVLTSTQMLGFIKKKFK